MRGREKENWLTCSFSSMLLISRTYTWWTLALFLHVCLRFEWQRLKGIIMMRCSLLHHAHTTKYINSFFLFFLFENFLLLIRKNLFKVSGWNVEQYVSRFLRPCHYQGKEMSVNLIFLIKAWHGNLTKLWWKSAIK